MFGSSAETITYRGNNKTKKKFKATSKQKPTNRYVRKTIQIQPLTIASE